MQRVDFSRNWSFYENNEALSFAFEHPKGHLVDLPHDFIIGKPRSADAPGAAGNGYFGDGQGGYKKVLCIPPEWEGKTILLASHNREDIAALCDTTVEIDRGKIVG